MSTRNGTVGFVGYGAMARLMAAHIRDAGYRTVAYTPSAEGGTAEDGTSMLASARALAEASTIVLVSVPNDEALAASAYGEQGFLAGLKRGGLVIDTSSVSPDASRRLAETGERRGIAVLDAPVSGSTPEAEKGELVVLVGGEADALARARPVLDAIGKQTIHVGPAGHGSTIKLVVNGIMVSTMAAIAETVGYGVAAGLDRATLLETLSGLAVVSPHHRRKLESAGDGDLDPQFPTALAHKDLGLLLADAAAHRAPVPTIAAATQLLSLTMQRHAEQDYSAVLPTAETLAGA
jgi:3-hydroxyisobutyrate dehydrogenase-like beta-hydroxyacid dehydrogenase